MKVLIELALHFKKMQYFQKYCEEYFLVILSDPATAIRNYSNESLAVNFFMRIRLIIQKLLKRFGSDWFFKSVEPKLKELTDSPGYYQRISSYRGYYVKLFN